MKKILTLSILLMCCLFIPKSCQAATKQVKFKVTVTYKIQKGEKLRLYVKGHKKNKKVKWKSTNKKIASISKNGVVTGKKGGTCKITAKIGKKKYKAKIFVLTGERTVYKHNTSPKSPSSRHDSGFVTLNITEKNLYIGQSITLKVSGTKRKITWKSSNSKVATVSNKGYVTSKGEGQAVITASYSDSKYIYELDCKITVNPLWMTEKALIAKGLFFIKMSDSVIHISGQSEKDSLTGSCESYLLELPENMQRDIIYGDKLRFKWDEVGLLYNTSDMLSLGLIVN